MKDSYFTGLDIGSQNVKIVVAQDAGERGLHIVGSAQFASKGVSKGSVVSIDDAVSSISQALEHAERMTGQPITRAAVAISGTHIITQESRGVVAVSRADGEVKEDDVERVIDAAQAVATPPNYDILHVIPLHFSVDSQAHIKDPVGMSGVRLEVVAQIILGLSGEIKNVTKTVFRTGLEIDDLVLGVLAAGECTLTSRQKELGVALVNIGSSTTSVAVFEEGDMLLAEIIPIGSGHITSDLAIGLRTSIEAAEAVKLDVGRVSDSSIGKKEEINLADYADEETDMASLIEVQEIIEARLEEIFDYVNQRLSKVGRAGRLPSGIVFTGGGAKLPGIVEFAKDHFKLPASLGHPTTIEHALDESQSMEFTTACGLAVWDREWRGGSNSMRAPGGQDIKGVVTGITSKISSIFRR